MTETATSTSIGQSDSRYESYYDRIGRPKSVVAPMVDHSDLAYRMLTRCLSKLDILGCLTQYSMIMQEIWCPASLHADVQCQFVP
jgi:hypothetical protein